MSAIDSASEELLVGLDERSTSEHPLARLESPSARSAAVLFAIVVVQLVWLGGFLYAAYRFLSY